MTSANRFRFAVLSSVSSAAVLLSLSQTAQAATLSVGPGKTYATLNDVVTVVNPGDVVNVYGDATYPGNIWFKKHGTAALPITIRGIPVNGKRPVLSGGTEWTVLFYGDHYIFENFEVTGGAGYCIINKADSTLINNTVVHDCPNHGILGTDSESGSLTIQYSEIYRCGNADKKHQLYIATDETLHPGSVFRLQNTYIHDGTGGNNVKSRAERTEIYFNWIEGAFYHELDLIGPDGQDANIAREDSDIVGNVFVKKSQWQIARIGGDGTGATFGRYRFVNNTFVLADTSTIAIRLQYELESVEMHNNVFYRNGGAATELFRRSDPAGTEPVIFGTNNWIPTGWTNMPAGLSTATQGTVPGFSNATTFDFRPIATSALVDRGASNTSNFVNHLFPNPFAGTMLLPPYRKLLAPGTAMTRSLVGAVDIGAWEAGSSLDPSGAGGSSGAAGAGGSGAAGAGGSVGAAGSGGSGSAGAAGSGAAGKGGSGSAGSGSAGSGSAGSGSAGTGGTGGSGGESGPVGGPGITGPDAGSSGGSAGSGGSGTSPGGQSGSLDAGAGNAPDSAKSDANIGIVQVGDNDDGGCSVKSTGFAGAGGWLGLGYILAAIRAIRRNRRK